MSWHPPKDPASREGKGWSAIGKVGRHWLRLDLAQYTREAAEAERLAEEFDAFSPEELQAELRVCAAAWRRHPDMVAPELIALRPRAMALVSIAARRTVKLSPSRPQFIAAIAMSDACIVQLAPGEGKTLAVAMAGIFYAWTGRPCHTVTSNDYLAERDAELMRPLYEMCGATVASVVHDTKQELLQSRYACDIVYATANRFLADFLRDRLITGGASGPARRRLWQLRAQPGTRQPVQRGLFAAIVDEADGVLIDEATTPLIISSPEPNEVLVRAIETARDLIDRMELDRHYKVAMEPQADIRFTDEGEDLLEELAHELPEFWQVTERRDSLMVMAILAREIFQRDRHYVIQDGKVIIVDENTGRLMPGRSWSHGIHQSIEAREGLELTDPAKTVARMTFQAYFRHYHRLAGASGTLQGVGRECWHTYGSLTVRLAPRVPSKLVIARRRSFALKEEKIEGLVSAVVRLHAEGLPVLVGTRRILDSEEVARRLELRGIECQVLNAKQHELEAKVVADAGHFGRVTVATNMAGRGTDILLAPGVLERGGLQVLMLEPHEARRIDWQLFGRAGRQGAPGRAQSFVSLEDDLLERHLPLLAQPLKWLAGIAPLRGLLIGPLVRIGQWRAQRTSWRYRQLLAERDEQLATQLSFSGEV